jgi:hypothetical protein
VLLQLTACKIASEYDAQTIEESMKSKDELLSNFGKKIRMLCFYASLKE